MRVLVIGRFTSIHTIRFAEELQRQGVHVAALWIGPSTSRPNVPIYHAKKNMRICDVPRTATLGCLLYVWRAILDFRPDIIHVQDDERFACWLNLICPQTIRRAYTNWGHNPDGSQLRCFRRAIANTDLLTSDADDVLAEITAFAPDALRLIVRFGIDPELFFPGDPSRSILSKYNLDPDGLYVLSPRSLRPIYNQVTLIRALPAVLGCFPALRVILKHHHVENYSDSHDYECVIREEAKRLGVWDRIIRLDHLPHAHLAELYRLSRVAVSIPLEDGFPATIFEAMACGCPLIVSEDKSYDGVIVNGRNSITISPQDTVALATGLERILKDRGFTNAIRDGALNTVSELGDFSADISRLIRSYEMLLHTHSR